jgi:hypothetical protein
MELNGKTRMTLTIAGAIAVLAAVFTAGVSFARLDSHVDNDALHETPMEKTNRINDRINLRLRPIEVQLDEINKKIDHLLSKE